MSLVALIYGANYIVAKEVMPLYIKPLGFVFMRVSIAGLLFWMSHKLFVKESVLKADLPRLAACGLFGVAMNMGLFFSGLSLTSPINASILMTTTPILVLLLSAYLLKEKVGFRKGIGVLIGLIGAVALIFSGKSIDSISGDPLGDLMVFVNAASYGLYLILVKPLMGKYQPITVIKWVFLFGFLFITPFSFQQVVEVSWRELPFAIMGAMAFVVLFTTFLNYLFNVLALRTASPTLVSFYIYLQPVLASLFAILLGKDSLDFVKVIASIAIFIGVYLVSKTSRSITTSR